MTRTIDTHTKGRSKKIHDVMKKFFVILGIVALAGAAVPALAQVTPGQIPGPIVQQTGPTSISGWVDVLLTVVRWIYTLVFILAVLFILLAAFYFVTSQGNPDKVTKAKTMLLYAVIGIAVALLSYGIVTLVRNSLASGLQS